jgi:hypothetical protein
MMRTTDIKIDGMKKAAVLVAGGPGFKIYTLVDYDGWVLALGRKISKIDDSSPFAQSVADYVNIKYHSLNTHEVITSKFNELISLLGLEGKSVHPDAPINKTDASAN